MKRLLTLVTCLALALCFSYPSPTEGAAAILKLGRLLARGGRAADNAAEVAQRVNRVARISPELRAAALGREGEALVSAYRTVEVESLIGRLGIDMPAFDRLLRQPLAARMQWGDDIALADDLPNVRVRTPATRGSAEALRLFARERLQPILSEPFDVDDLKVVVAGLADDSTRSAQELSAFRRTIPSAHWDEVGYMARLDGTSLTRAEMARRLQVYEGKTIVLVGHVPEGTSNFIVHLPDGQTRQLDVQLWVDAAREARVNLIPLGCNSERLGPIGARGLLNSRRIRVALRDVIERRPGTVGDFLRELTRNDLKIVVDPIDAHLLSNGLAIRTRRNNELAGHLLLNGARSVRPALDYSNRVQSATEVGDQVQTCLAAASAPEFDTCVDGIRARDAAQLVAETRQCRADNLRLLPGLRAEAEQAVVAGRWHIWVTAVALVASGLLLAWFAMTSRPARQDEQDFGPSLYHMFNRWRLHELRLMLTSPEHRRDAIERMVIAAIILALVIGFVFVASFAWYVWILYAFVGLMIFGFVVDYGRRAVQELSLVNTGVAVAFAAVFITACIYNSAVWAAAGHAEAVDRWSQELADNQAGTNTCYPIAAGQPSLAPPVITVSPPKS